MYTLYIDTHANKINIIVFYETKVIINKEVVTNYNHSMTTMPILIKALNDANIHKNDLNQILVVNGPGSFTGVRIGVTIAKTLALTLHIPIKILSSLLIKAISFSHEEVTIVEREKNGVFLGLFDKRNQLIGKYSYLYNNDYKTCENGNYVEDVEINYEEIIKYANKIESINPHTVNPLYVKKIEVQK